MSDLTNTIKDAAAAPLAQLSQTLGPAAEAAPAWWPSLDQERYQDLEILGMGGMGHVYKAYDRLLQRTVALKFLHADDPALVHRMILEARAQARVEHANICKIYEVGSVEGRPFISMQCIEGETLRAAHARMSLPQKIQTLLKVCEAVHEAHRKGLIHRDIKPANIMVERLEDGTFNPYVLDFGLSREMGEAGMTISGRVVGTPKYMAPEQARGLSSALDRRADVYSLGATLYEILAGKTPFEGASAADILFKLLSEDAAPLRSLAPSLPQDLETIAMKCLEKEPQRRYDSALALAEDLRRYLDGEPITARRADWGYRLAKKARKHKLLVAFAALALISVVVAGLLVARARWMSAEQARLAARLGEEVKTIENIARFGAMSPLHDRRAERQLIQARMAGIREQVRRLGELAGPPGDYALGRGYLALGDRDKALELLRGSWEAGYHEPQAAYALGWILGEQYRERRRELEKIREPERLREARARLERELREPALQFLRETRASGLSLEAEAYVQGLIALYEERPDDAIAGARRAREQAPWLYEAWKLEGDAYVLRGGRKMRSDFEGALEDARLAGEAYHQAIDLARSEPSLYEAECGRWFWILEMRRSQEQSVASAFADGLGACGDALRANPDSADAYFSLARLHFRRGTASLDRGEDPSADLEAGVRLAREALRLRPGDAEALETLTSCLLSRGEWELARERDASAWIGQARRELLALLPGVSMNNLAISYLLEARDLGRRGEDPRPALEQALGWICLAIDKEPRRAWLLGNQARLYLERGRAELDRGLDPRPSTRLALDVADRYAAAYPQNSEPLLYRAEALLLEAQRLWSHGADVRPELDPARAAAGRALELGQDRAWAHRLLGEISRLEALRARSLGQAEAPAFECALDELAEAARLSPGDVEIRRLLAWTLFERGTPSRRLPG